MKYYYLSHEGPFRNNVVVGKDVDRIIRDKNKIIITRINGLFHVLVCKNGVFEKEKIVLSYFELVNYLKRISFNVYFVNVNSETAYFINSYVKKEDEVNRKEKNDNKTEPFYTINDGKMYQLETFINRDVIKNSIMNIYEREIQSEDKCHEISLVDFVQNTELFDLYHLPFKEKSGQFLIPNYSYSSPKSFYILSGIYHKNGDIINLSSTDLTNLCMLKNVEKQVIDDIINNIEVHVIKEYSMTSVNNVVEFLTNQDNDSNTNSRLKLLREHLIEANDNMGVIENLNILKNNITDNNQNILTK